MGIEGGPKIFSEDKKFEEEKKRILEETGGKEIKPGEKGKTMEDFEEWKEKHEKGRKEAHPEEYPEEEEKS